jgi:predicted SprT family Zn-dependent metalloprotease
MNAKQIVDEAVAILASLNRSELAAVKVKASNGMKVAAGKARLRAGEHTLLLSVPIFSRPENQHAFRNTVLHEAAHIIAGLENGHNRVWKLIARSIGCTGERCHMLATPERKTRTGSIILACPCGNQGTLGAKRAARFVANPKSFSCNHCKRREFEIVESEQ